jgi:CRP/FNR family cyclic AMP-dependent transcriptional regulator
MIATVPEKIFSTFGAYPKRSYPKGQILVFADENPEHIYYIIRGKVRQYDVSYRGDEVIVNVFKSPAFFPMAWAINRSPNRFFYKTEEETEVHVVPVDVALQFIKDNPDVLLDLVSRIYHGVDGLLGRVVHLMSGTAKSRLMYEIIIECRRFGEEKTDGEYMLSVNESDIAARTGLARETISREMQKLKDKGWISIKQDEISVTDIAGLEKALGTEI